MSVSPANSPDPSVERFDRLCRALQLVDQLAGQTGAPAHDPVAAAAYPSLGAISRRRFDAIAAETAAFAAAGIEVLMRQRAARGECRVAASRLAGEMRAALGEMEALARR